MALREVAEHDRRLGPPRFDLRRDLRLHGAARAQGAQGFAVSIVQRQEIHARQRALGALGRIAPDRRAAHLVGVPPADADSAPRRVAATACAGVARPSTSAIFPAAPARAYSSSVPLPAYTTSAETACPP